MSRGSRTGTGTWTWKVSVARRRIQGLVLGVLGMDPVADGSKSFRSRRVESREGKRVFSDERIRVGRARRE